MDLIEQYNQDVLKYGGYVYSQKNKYSARVANERITQECLLLGQFADKRVLDIGCGDGTYTYEIFNWGHTSYILGLDLSKEAIKSANKKFKKGSKIEFKQGDAYSLPKNIGEYDIAVLRGVLHHLDKPLVVLREVFKVCEMVIIVEPNGYNPIVRLLEMLSPYHIKHSEKSYYPPLINSWINKLGWSVDKKKFVNLVPFFCPDIVAKSMKSMEFFVESLPVIRQLLCGVYVLRCYRR